MEVFLEFPHEKIARCSSTVRRSKEAHRNPLGSPGPGPGQLQPVTTSQSIISVAPPPPPVLNPLNPRSGSMRYSSSQAGDTSLRHRAGKQGSSRESLSKKSSVTSVTSDINECGLPIPPPPPIPPDQPQPFLTTFSKNVKNKKQFPRSSIRRSIRKYHWTDVNNNNNNNSSRSDNESFLDPHQSLTPYNGETMKSSGESVYF